MKKQFKPYFVLDSTIFFTDGVEEVFIYKDERKEASETISMLLNDAYNAAYQDGITASLNEQHLNLINKIKALSIENSRLKRKMEITKNDFTDK